MWETTEFQTASGPALQEFLSSFGVFALRKLALRTVQRELAMLIKIGLVTSRTNGYHVFYRANRNHVLFAPLQQLVFKSERCVLGRRKPRKRRRQSWRESRTR